MLHPVLVRPATRLLNWILPRACVSCGLVHTSDDGNGLCPECLRGLRGLGAARCLRCALKQPCEQTTCAACATHRFSFDATLALCDYAHPIDRMIQALKFERRWAIGLALGASLGETLSAALLDRLKTLVPANERTIALCAIPLSNDRLIERGFNQSALLAQGVALALRRHPKARGWQINNRQLLKRQRHTVAQTLVERGSRIRNLGQAFAPKSAGIPKVVVLIDDVMTTGATLNNAALALREAGCTTVMNLVVARA